LRGEIRGARFASRPSILVDANADALIRRRAGGFSPGPAIAVQGVGAHWGAVRVPAVARGAGGARRRWVVAIWANAAIRTRPFEAARAGTRGRGKAADAIRVTTAVRSVGAEQIAAGKVNVVHRAGATPSGGIEGGGTDRAARPSPSRLAVARASGGSIAGDVATTVVAVTLRTSVRHAVREGAEVAISACGTRLLLVLRGTCGTRGSCPWV
jgi:hypothetical protein